MISSTWDSDPTTVQYPTLLEILDEHLDYSGVISPLTEQVFSRSAGKVRTAQSYSSVRVSQTH